MWVRAVWLEGDMEEEGVVPESWVNDNRVHWPPGSNAFKALKSQQKPGASWTSFKLIKIKMRSENYKDAEEYDCTTTAETGEESEEEIGKRKPKKRQFDDFITDKVLPPSQQISKSAAKTHTENTTEDSCPVNLPEPPTKVPPVGRTASPAHDIHAVTETSKPMSSRMRSRSPNDDMPTVSQLLGASQDSLFSNQTSRSPSVEQTTSTSRSMSRSPSIINNCDRISLISYRSFYDRIRSCRTSSPSPPPSENRSLRSPSLSTERSSSSYKNRSHRSRSPLTQESSTSYENRSHKSLSHSTQRSSSGYNKNGSHRSSSPSTQGSSWYNKNRFNRSPSPSAQRNSSLFNKNRSNRSPSHSTRRSSQSDENRSPSRSAQRSGPCNKNRSNRSLSRSVQRSSPCNKNRSNRSPSHSTQRSSPCNKNRSNRLPSYTTKRSSPCNKNRSHRSPSHSTQRSSPCNKNRSNRSPSHSTKRKSLCNKNRSIRSPSHSTQRSSPCNKNRSNRSQSHSTQRSSPCYENGSHRSLFPPTQSRLPSKNGSYRSNPSHTSSHRSRSRDRSPDDTGFPMSTAKFQKRVLHMLVDIRKELQAQQKVQCVDGFAISRAETLDEFVQLESSSKIAEERKAMVDVLSKVGGGNIRDNVKIMGKLMTNELMSKFNMKGGKDKMAFRHTSLMGVVTASVLKTPSMDMHTEQDISKALAHCLKYAPDRRGGGGRGKYDADRQATT